MGGALTLLSGLAYVRDIDTDLLIRTAFDREIFAALAMYYFAEDAFAKQETGVAVGFCHLSLRKLSAQGAGKFDPFRPGLPNLSAKGYVHFLPIIEECTTKISTLCKSCERENK
jgi:hypothetical protein